jgi:hypothetical protein
MVCVFMFVCMMQLVYGVSQTAYLVHISHQGIANVFKLLLIGFFGNSLLYSPVK